MSIDDAVPAAEIEALEALANSGVPAKRGEGQLRSHKRMAYRFAEAFRGRFMYTPGRGWLEFNGAYWRECGEARPWNGVESVCRDALDDLKRMESGARDKLYADIRSCDTAQGTSGVLAFAKHWPGIGRRDEDLDAQSHLFAVQNGTLNLWTGEFRQSNPRDLLTLAGGCNYDPDAECPLYDELMELYQPDKEIREYLHRLAGAAMEGTQNLQNLITWYGATGGNGKGTTIRAWQAVFGTYARVMPVEAFLGKKGDNNQYRDEKAQLKGARLVLATEPTEGARFDTGTVKALTGGDRVKARAVYRSAIEFDPTWLIIMATNNRVATPDDGGMARRLKEIRWGYTVPRGEMRDDIDARLIDEAPGILNRILAGWFDFRDNGVRHPESVEKATAEYLAEVDPIAGFLAECVEEKSGTNVSSSALYARYKEWCEEDGVFAKSQRVFSESLSRRGFSKTRLKTGIIWHDVRIVSTMGSATPPF